MLNGDSLTTTICDQDWSNSVTKGLNSKNGTGRHGTSIQSELTKLSHFLICLRYTSRLHVYEI
jgi:hypothetical protein